ncbi:amino acid adenylation domain-containing protein, partial [uncultured Chitinophaga sp.]|uniref:amino acid adenylation domain-containing protein n=1 Tax=uncultured Chitinophaga sp. TaxID=339340 RepID=UPI002636FB2C
DAQILIGKPITATEIFILSEAGRLCPIGVTGEICITGAGLAKQYLNNPELTAQKFIANPYRPGSLMYWTGDLGRWLPQGEIQYIGRKDEQVKIKGYRIEPGEIENAILTLADISTAVVVTVPNTAGEPELATYFTAKRQIDVAEIRSHLTSCLPAYMLPAHYMQLEVLPLTTNGKVDKKMLPLPDGSPSAAAYVAPANDTEQQIAHIWQEILGRERVGIRDSFFDLGGDSIKILRMLAAVRKQLNLDIPVADVYKHPTIEALLVNIHAHKDDRLQLQMKRQQKEAEIRAEIEALKEKILSTLSDTANIEDIYPMSDIEKGMVFESMVKGIGVYHDIKVFQKVLPDFDIMRFRHALQLLSDKHPILRTAFNLSDFDREVQIVYKAVNIDSDYQDLSSWERSHQEAHIREFSTAAIKRPFNLSTAPLWRMAAFNLGKDEIVFVFQCHHAIIDGWSEMSFITELNNLYLKLSENSSYIPEKLKASYKEFIVQHELDKKDEQISAFWQQELEYATRLDIFTRENTLDAYTLTFKHEELDQLKNTASALNTSIKVISLSAYLYLLKLLNYEPGVLAGLVTNTRPNCEDGDAILGCFLNTIPLHVNIADSLTGAALAAIVHEKLVLLKDKERLSILEIARLHGKQHEAGNPFFDVIFNYVDFHVMDDLQDSHTPDANGDAPSRLNVNSVVQGNTYFDFTIDTTAGQYKINLSLTKKLHSGIPAEQIVLLYCAILKHIIHTPHLKIEQAQLMSAEEKDRLLTTFNNTAADIPAGNTLISLFEEQVQRHPDKTAILFEGKVISYRELDEVSNQLGRYLRQQYAIQSDDRIGIMIGRNEWMIVSILGVLKSGGAYVPIDEHYPEERIAYIMHDSSCRLLIDDAELAKFNEIRDQYDRTSPDTSTRSSNLAYVIYTSGSTGHPKGCMLEHKGIINRISWMWQHYALSTSDVIMQKTAFTFDVSVWEIFVSLCFGASMLLCTKEDAGSPARLLSLIKQHQVTCSHFVPSMLNAFIAALSDDEGAENTLSSLRMVISSGEALALETVKRWYAKTAVPLYNLYGPTEASIEVTHYATSAGDNKVPIGRPIWNTHIYILGKEQQLLPVGITGELCIGGIGLSRGYLNNPDLTAEKFIPDPFKKGARIYRTNDLARWLPDGNIEYVGRQDCQVKIRGYRIEPGEIEQVLLKLETVNAVTVQVWTSPQGDKELVGYVVSKEHLVTSDLRAFLDRSLPTYMIPAYFVQLPALPLTSSGKINRRALPAPVEHGMSTGTTYVAPRNAMEEKLVMIWQEVLGKEKIGMKDNFFESGGHSLKIIQLISRIRKTFEVSLSPGIIFNHPTVEGIYNEIESIYWANNELFKIDSAENTENFSI